MGAPPDDRRAWDRAELAARRLAGAPEIAPVIRNFASPQIAAFFASLPLIFAAGLDRDGRPSATILRGQAGFVTAPDPHSLDIAANFPAGDAIMAAAGAPMALIGIDFAARRRNRVNGRLRSPIGEKLSIAIEEAFGNCPKHISARQIAAGPPGAWGDFFTPGPEELAMAERADFFLLATRGENTLDLSHRGGPPGFVVADAAGGLNIPDYPGNHYFNSFGNLLADPRAALLFPDFSQGRALQLSGVAAVDFAATPRAWRFQPERARIWSDAPPAVAAPSSSDPS